MSIISVRDAAERLGISRVRVRQLIHEGRLPAEKVGRDYIIHESDLDRPEVCDRRPGRAGWRDQD
jgi:excisionase family DNA binding protein